MGAHPDPLNLVTNGAEVGMIHESMIHILSFQACHQVFRFLMGHQRWITLVKHWQVCSQVNLWKFWPR